MNRSALQVLFVALALLLSGCIEQPGRAAAGQAARGSAFNGQHLIFSYGCGTCHVIPGISEADGTTGPPLTGFASRLYIAGVLTNEPAHLIEWLENPQQIVADNAMPNLGITEQQARDIAAYLYTLR